MKNRDFICDTEVCVYWDEKYGCQKETAISIQEHCCIDYERKRTERRYRLIAGIPKMLSTIYVTPGGGIFYKGRLLGYDSYGGNPSYKTYCVEVQKENGYKFVDFFRDIYSLEEGT